MLSGADESGHAEARLSIIGEQACSWAFANAVRNGALDAIVRVIDLIESDGVTVNLAAMARMTGVSRRTLHARLRAE
ncbi:hypothetical protein ACF07V_17535 [Streptomyces sp. NPDC015661]|uniref:hypothetical protein n=1 Tax=Streptomyces sp. NPDC015661 TaxID=3364961 RepID=UPI003700FD77